MAFVPSLREALRALPVLTAVPPDDFDTTAVPGSPHELFIAWFRQAVQAGEVEPHAMTLSTCDEEGRPDARVLILKDLDAKGWWFATSAASAKGRQLEELSAAALTFYWRTVGRQVRVRGNVLRAPDETAAADFRARSLEARAVALASRVSEPLPHASECVRAVEGARSALGIDPELLSRTWAVYAVQPEEVEFWQADAGRQHTRLRYSATGSVWEHTLLWP